MTNRERFEINWALAEVALATVPGDAVKRVTVSTNAAPRVTVTFAHFAERFAGQTVEATEGQDYTHYEITADGVAWAALEKRETKRAAMVTL